MIYKKCCLRLILSDSRAYANGEKHKFFRFSVEIEIGGSHAIHTKL